MSLNTFRNQRVKLRFSRAYGNSSPLAVPVERQREGIKLTRRGVFLCFKVIFALALLAGLGLGGQYVCKHHIWGGDRFTVKEIRVSTDGELTRPEILAKAGLQEGVRIFDVNLSEARKGLEEVSQIETIEVERFLPSTLVVRLTERKPVAWILEGAETDPGAASRAYVVDAKGWVMPQRKVSMQLRYLPVINGAHDLFDNLTPGQRAGGYEIQSAIRLLTASESIARFRPRVIDLSKGFCMEVTDLTRTKYTFGFDRLDDQLSKMQQVMTHTEHSGREVSSVNLMYAKQIPVVFGGLVQASKVEEKADRSAKGAAAASSGGGEQVVAVSRGVSAVKTAVSTGGASPAVSGGKASLPSNPLAAVGGNWGGVAGGSVQKVTGSSSAQAKPVASTATGAATTTVKRVAAEPVVQRSVMKTVSPGTARTTVQPASAPKTVIPKATAVSGAVKRLDATSVPATPKAGSPSGGGVLQAPADSIRKLFNKNG
jgi:cell division septal protein FtsQ